MRALELADLRADLIESVGREKILKSSVFALGDEVSLLDKEVRYAHLSV